MKLNTRTSTFWLLLFEQNETVQKQIFQHQMHQNMAVVEKENWCNVNTDRGGDLQSSSVHLTLWLWLLLHHKQFPVLAWSSPVMLRYSAAAAALGFCCATRRSRKLASAWTVGCTRITPRMCTCRACGSRGGKKKKKRSWPLCLVLHGELSKLRQCIHRKT